MAQALHRLRVRRRWVLAEMALLGVAVVLLAEIGLIRTSTLAATSFLLVLLVALLGMQGSRLLRRFVSLVHSECPACGGLFFVSWPRIYWSLPYLHASCAHCGLSLRGRR